ncbi:MAG: glycosyltransferase [Lachnospiraceae bacterium]|nr:glycosyltransferase [Lachnospiraceae bacterium]
MKVSVLLCTYNGEKYVEEQLKSLLWQTHMPDEVIIIDDLSTDNTVGAVKNFILENLLSEKWKLIVNEENKGWKRNFMEGIRLTKGDILFFCDQDDVWFQNKVELMYDFLEQHPEVKIAATDTTSWMGGGI